MTTLNTDELLIEIRKTHVELQAAFAALPSMLDLPGNLTERQRGVEIDRRARLPQYIVSCGSLIEQLTKAVATLVTRTPQRDRLRAAKAAIEKQIAEAVDWRTLTGRARDQEWARQNVLTSSLTAIERGVEYFGGQPALPAALRSLLTDTCGQCGHTTLAWSGPLPDLEQEIAKAESTLALIPSSLASLRSSVAPYLVEAVSA
jgi:hypothetical protein